MARRSILPVVLCAMMMVCLIGPFSSPATADETMDNYPEGDAWLNLELLSWGANESYEWENDGTSPDPQFRVCIDVDGESDGVSPQCSMTQIWADALTLESAWSTTFDLPDDTSILNLTIECWDNDEANDEWGNGPDACDMNPDVSEWRLYSEFNWTTATIVNFSGDGNLDNDTEWGNAETSWRATIIGYGDEDSDGVSDNVDNCHESTIDLEVDEWGCTWKQYDWDDDGINNSEDPCPKITDEYCGTEGQYIATSRLELGHGSTPRFVHIRTPLNQYDISPDGENIALMIEGKGIVVVNLSKLTPSYAGHTWTLDGWNSGDEPSSSWADYGVPDFLYAPSSGTYREYSMMKFTYDSETLVVSGEGAINLYETNPFDYSRGSGAQPYVNFGIGNCYSAGVGLISLSQNGEYVHADLCENSNTSWSSGFVKMDLETGMVQDSEWREGDVVWGNQTYPQNGDYADMMTSGGNFWTTENLRPDGLSISYDWENQLVRLFNADSPEITLQTIQIPFHDLITIDSTNDGHSVVLFSANQHGFAEECNYDFCMDDYAIELYNISTGQSREITLNLPLAANNSNHHGVEAIESVSISENGLRMVVVYREFYGGSVRSRLQPIQIFERDRDSDGFVDTKDLCPTEPGDISGCLEEFFDSDEDGVNDAADECSATPQGAEVNSVGCASTELDADSDGVSDANDQCANTPSGQSVGLTGCSPSQSDSDNDGIYDSIDNCPYSPPSSVVDSAGCAEGDVVDLDADGDGVRDSADTCSETPIGTVVDSQGCKVVTNNPDDNPEGSESEAMNWPIFCGALIAVSIIVGMIVLVREGNVPTSTPSSTIRSASSVSGSTPKRHSQQPIVHSNPDKEMLRKAQSAENEARIVLEQQRRENQRLREKMNQSTSISSVQMEKMRSEMSQLEQELKEKELALIEKEKLLQDAEEKSSSTVVQNITYNIHDSAITSDEFGNIIGKKDD